MIASFGTFGNGCQIPPDVEHCPFAELTRTTMKTFELTSAQAQAESGQAADPPC